MIRCFLQKGVIRSTTIIFITFFVIVTLVLFAWYIPFGRISYTATVTQTDQLASVATPVEAASTEVATTTASSTVPVFKARHIQTPRSVKAVYMSSWAAGHSKFRKHLFDLIDTTEINSVVIDVKDYTGRISFKMDDPTIIASGAIENRIPDIKEFIEELHKRNIYVIGRISVFQDSHLINVHPDYAVKTKAGQIWKDYKGVKWLDAAAKPVWDYIVTIGKESYKVGFDELNFDYIRFPSDGNLEDIAYTWSKDKTRVEVIRDFFEYIHTAFSGTGIPTSADLFGLTTSADDDLGIGQILEYGLKYFDYVAPMVYPSHYGKGFNGFTKPAQYPYEVIKVSMGSAIAKAEATTTRSAMLGIAPIASTTPQLYTKESFDKSKLRPWLQAFDLGAIYTPEMVRKQIQATYDVGLDGWMLWNAACLYDKDALLPK